MNEQDKEAFEKAMEKLYNQPPSELWEAALRYEREKTKILIEDMESTIRFCKHLEDYFSGIDLDDISQIRKGAEQALAKYRG